MKLNYKLTAGDPMMPFIRFSLPSDLADSCRLVDWKNNILEIGGQREKLFLQLEAGSSHSLSEPYASFLLTPET